LKREKPAEIILISLIKKTMPKQKDILDILVSKNLIEAKALEQAKEESEKNNRNLEELIVEKGLITEQNLYQSKAEFLKIPFKDLAGYKPGPDILKLVPLEAAQHYRFVPLNVDKDTLEVGILNPEDIDTSEALKFIAHRNNLIPKAYLITLSDFRSILKEYSNLKGEIKQALDELRKEIEKEEKKSIKEGDEEKIEKIAEEAPISKVVALIIKHAIEQDASDIHIEPTEKAIRVRFRIDGILYTNLTLPVRIHPAVVSRIKILSHLKIDETRKPQDGRFFTQSGKKKIDFRVSTFPTYTGEKVVMRILDPTIGLREFSDLGLESRNLDLLKRTIQKPHGIILLTGPTGSGKTTTLYSILHVLNEEGVNIVSLEDPIEYFIDGVNQSQVRPEIGYTFATGLRHILRQDPDKIMVGEIRDNETAALAIHAALTGHLVLSTLHTNDATGVIPRLIDMGIDRYLIPPTLILAIAQRLVQRLCPNSKREMSLSPEMREMVKRELGTIDQDQFKKFKLKEPLTFYEPKPTRECPKGTKGRIAIYEILEMTPQLEEIVLKEASESNIKQEAKRQGMITMLQDGILKASRGIVGLEEVKKEVEE
jgi:type IV pilus assembly protein PilB